MQYRDNGPLLKQPHEGVDKLIARLGVLDIQCLPARLGQKNITDRIGGTIIVPRYRPVIWIDLDKHKTDEDLVDTLCHESVHATAVLTERWQSLPDQTIKPLDYLAEELVAYVGSSATARLINYDIGRTNINRNRSSANIMNTQLRRNDWTPKQITRYCDYGEEAAIILAAFDRHTGIDAHLNRQIEALDYI